MTEREKLESGLLADPYDPESMAIRNKCHSMNTKFNNLSEDDTEARNAVLKEMLCSIGEGTYIQGPISFHYGKHIKIGKHTFANFNFTIQDDSFVEIGDYCNFGPNVSIVTALHPMLANERRHLRCPDGTDRYLCYAKPVKIGNDCWFGTGAIVCPGVTIGDNCVIGAGSVVLKDIPPNSFAAGNPCRVIRTLTEADSLKYKPEVLSDYRIID